jgi:CheY-like chemotaxis protein
VSLNGNLEDLPLLDILQIVSFSKKTGYLAIRSGAGNGAIVFQEGLVVSAFTWADLPLDPRFGSLGEDQRAAVVRTRIEVALETLIRLREGQFSFSLTEAPPKAIAGRDLVLETLGAGINPQQLLLDLARGLDEDRRDSMEAVESSFATPEEPRRRDPGTVPLRVVDKEPAPDPAIARPLSADTPPLGVPEAVWPEPKAPPLPIVPPGRRTLLLVDDEEDIRRILAGVFTESGYEVMAAEDPEDAVKIGGKLGKDGRSFVLVTDLGMPTSGGSSFQGGFEVVKRLWKMNLRPPVLMMTESLNPSLQLRARQMGISRVVFKPGLSKLNPRQFEADLLTFAQKLVVEALPRLEQAAAAPLAKKKVPTPSAPVAPDAAPAPPPEAAELTRQFSLLQRRLADLRRPTEAKEISLLVMTVAREFFERAILLLVKHEELRGLGGFGRGPKGMSVNLLAREIAIPLAEPSVFKDVVTEARSFAGPWPEGKWSAHLLGRIGRFQSSRVALLPLVTHRETIAVLFGDNPETGRDLGRLDALEVFVHQAGIAFENAFLQRKLQTLQGQAGERPVLG